MAANEIEVTVSRLSGSSELEVIAVEKDVRKYDSLYSAISGIGRERFWTGSLAVLGGAATIAGIVITAGEAINYATTRNVDWNRAGFGVVSLGNAIAMLARSMHDFTKASRIADRLRQQCKSY